MSLGLKGIKKITDFELKDQVLFLRLDLNVPLKGSQITDDNRLRAALPTIRYAIEKGAKIILASHLGRPKDGVREEKYSLEPVAKYFTEALKKEVLLVQDLRTDFMKMLLTTLRKDQIILLENLRFEAGETKNDPDFARVLSSVSQVYINDAFGASHRAHASIHALPEQMQKKGIGFLIEKEIEFLDRLLANPEKPYIAVLGGSKVSDKIEVIEKLIDLVDGFIIGGAMAYTFLKALNHPVGKSLVESDKIRYAKELMERMEARGKTILLPIDHIITESITDTNCKTTSDVSIPEGYLGVDIGPKTREFFSAALSKARTIFWNGPMGVFETPEFAKGSFAIARAMAENTGVRVVGGGDSASAVQASGFAEKMSHISTGGGASLEYLQGERLPGLEVLRVKTSSQV